jgi:hypothetical protein
MAVRNRDNNLNIKTPFECMANDVLIGPAPNKGKTEHPVMSVRFCDCNCDGPRISIPAARTEYSRPAKKWIPGIIQPVRQ